MDTVNASQMLRVPLYDLPTAVEVFATKDYQKMPSILEKTHALMGLPPPRPKLKEDEIVSTKSRLNEMMRLRLMWSRIPENFEVPVVDDGKVVLRVENEFEASLTLLHGVTQVAPWTLIKLKFLVAPDHTYGDNYVTTDYNRRVEGIANAAMESDPRNPLAALYNVAHTFAQNLQLELLQSQAEIEKPVESGTVSAAAAAAQSRQKVLVQAMTVVPGVSLELSFAGGFRLKFSTKGANGAAATDSNESALLPPHVSPSSSSILNNNRKAHRLGKRKSKRSASSSINGLNTTTAVVTTRGATLSLKEKRIAATRLTVESFPSVIDPISGDIAIYEVDPQCVDLESIVSRAKRMHSHEKLEILADAIRHHLSASQEFLQARIDSEGLEKIIVETDEALLGASSSPRSATQTPRQTSSDFLGAITPTSSSIPTSPINIRTSSMSSSGQISSPFALADNFHQQSSSHAQQQQQHQQQLPNARPHMLLSLSPNDVSVQINQDLLKSYISIRLFETYSVHIHLSYADGQPVLSPGIGLDNAQIDSIQRKLRSYASDLTGSDLAEALTELQRQAVAYGLRKIAVSCALSAHLNPSAPPSADFTRQFGKHYAIFSFHDPTMSQSRLVVLFDQLHISSALPLGASNATSTATNSNNVSLFGSNASITKNPSSSSQSQQHHAAAPTTAPLSSRHSIASSSASITTQGTTSHLSINTSNNSTSNPMGGAPSLPNISNAYAPLRVRFILLPSQTPDVYSDNHYISLFPPPAENDLTAADSTEYDRDSDVMLDGCSAPSSSDATASFSSSASALPPLGLQSNGNRRGMKRSGGDDHGDDDDDDDVNGDALGSSVIPSAKRRKLMETNRSVPVDGVEAVHRLRATSSPMSSSASASSSSSSVGSPFEFVSVGEIKRRALRMLKQRASTMEWHAILEELVRACGALVTRALLLEDLDRAQSQYKPYGTPSEFNVGFSEVSSKRRSGELYFRSGNVRSWCRSFLLSKYSASPLQIQQLLITIDSDRWFVTLTESQSLLPSGFPVEPFLSSSRSTRYLPNKRQWIFTYVRATPFSQFFMDLRGLAFIHKVFLQFLALSKTLCPSGINHNDYLFTANNAAAAAAMTLQKTATVARNTAFHAANANSTLDLNFFRLVAFSPASITFIYGDQVHSAQGDLVDAASHSHAQTNPPKPLHSASTESRAFASDPYTVPSASNAFTIQLRGGNRKAPGAAAGGGATSASSTSFAWDSVPHVTFEPSSHPLTPFINVQIENWISDPNLRFLLELVWNVHPVLFHCHNFTRSQQGMLRTNDLLVVPHGVAKFRMFFRHWCLDWRFLGNRFVCVDEVKRPGESLPLLNFVPFMQMALQKIVSPHSSPTNTTRNEELNGSGGGTASFTSPIDFPTTTPSSNLGGAMMMMESSYGGDMMMMSVSGSQQHQQNMMDLDDPSSRMSDSLIPEMTPEIESEVLQVVSKQRGASHFYVGPSFVVFHANLTSALLPMLQAYFGSLRYFMVIEKEERAQRQTNEKGEYFVAYRRTHPEYEVSLILRKPSYMLDIAFPSSIGQDEVELLSHMFKTKVMCPPYRMAHLHAFLAIFLLPLSSLSDLISLLRLARDRTGITFDIHFPSKESPPINNMTPQSSLPPGSNPLAPIIVHPPASEDNQWRITLSLIFSNPEKQSIIMPITYNYKTRQLSSQDAFTSDYLNRNGITNKGFGSLSGAIDSLSRPLQRSWAAEHNMYLRRNPHLIIMTSSSTPLSSSAGMSASSLPSSTPNTQVSNTTTP